MASFFRKIFEGLRLVPKTVSTVSEAGDLDFSSGDSRLNLHNGSSASPLVTESHAATLTNKTIDGDNNTVQDLALSSLKTELSDANEFVVRDGAGAVVSAKVVPTGAVVGSSDTQTLTNKTIDGDLNTLQDIALTSLASGTARSVIARNFPGGVAEDSTFKLDGSAQIIDYTTDSTTGAIDALNTDQVGAIRFDAAVTELRGIANAFDGKEVRVLNRSGGAILIKDLDANPVATERIDTGSGDVSLPEGGVLIFRYDGVSQLWGIAGGSGSSDPDMVQGPASAIDGQMATYDGTTGKLIQADAPVFFDSTGKLKVDTAVQMVELVAAPTVAAGYGALYMNADQKPVFMTDAASAIPYRLDKTNIINYIIHGDFEDGIAGNVAQYSDTAGTAPVNGAGAGSITTTRAISSSSPLRGAYSMTLAKPASNAQGQGLNLPFTVDFADRAKVLQISFDYRVASGTYVTGDMSVWVYDITNSTLIAVAPASIENISGQARFQGTFQTSSTGSNYRLLLHIGSVSAVAYTLAFDNVVVSPQIITQGTPVTDWVSYTPTNTQGFGTVTSANFRWRRVGDSLEIQGGFTSGTVTGSTAQISLPPGLTIAGTASARIYMGEMIRAGGTRVTVLGVQGRDYMSFGAGASSQGDVVGSSLVGSTEALLLTSVIVPITGWSSQVQMSSETDTRVVASRAARSTNMTLTSTPTIVDFAGVTFDTTGSITTGASWKYTASVPGVYRIAVNAGYFVTAAANQQINIRLYKNGTQYSFLDFQEFETAVSVLSGTLHGSELISLNAGDYIDLRAASTASTNAELDSGLTIGVNIQRISGPSQIAASETVIARYSSSAGQSIASGATAIVDFATKSFDSHNAVTTGGSWKFTAPMAGKYKIYGKNRYANGLAWTQSGSVYFQVFKNGSSVSLPAETIIQTSFTSGTGPSAQGEDIVDLVAGDTLDIRASHQEAGARALLAAGTHNYITIVRVGN